MITMQKIRKFYYGKEEHILKELNKEVILTAEAIDTLVEEMTERDEMACKGEVKGISVCGVN